MTDASTNKVVTRVLYTALIGGYETLNERELLDPGMRALCFTDDPQLTSSTWEIIVIQPMFPSDPVRSQRMIKILGHELLQEFDEWLYIDNTVKMRESPLHLLEHYLRSHDLAIPNHSFRETLADEFDEVRFRDMDNYERVTEQLTHYAADYPGVLQEKPLWNAIIARRNTPLVRHWADIWWSHVQRYSRRDQLSVLVSVRASGVSVNRMMIDNFNSDVHEWPIANNRKQRARFTHVPRFPHLVLIFRISMTSFATKFWRRGR